MCSLEQKRLQARISESSTQGSGMVNPIESKADERGLTTAVRKFIAKVERRSCELYRAVLQHGREAMTAAGA
jgi:hypothetical protein